MPGTCRAGRKPGFASNRDPRRRCLAPRGTTAFASHFPVCTGAWHLSSRAGAGVCQQPWAPQGGAWHLGGLSLLLAIFRFVLVPGTYRAGRELGFASNPSPRRRCLAPRETTNPQAVPGTFGRLQLLLAIFRFVLVPGTYGTGRELGFASNPRPREAGPGTLKRF